MHMSKLATVCISLLLPGVCVRALVCPGLIFDPFVRLENGVAYLVLGGEREFLCKVTRTRGVKWLISVWVCFVFV